MRCPPSGRSGRGCCIATLESYRCFLHLNEPTVHGGSAHTHQHVLVVMIPCPKGSSCPLPALWQLSEISRAGQHNIACKIPLRKFCVRTLDMRASSPPPTWCASALSAGPGDRAPCALTNNNNNTFGTACALCDNLLLLQHLHLQRTRS